jgi:transcriptional regulator with XRE-family HTH domain
MDLKTARLNRHMTQRELAKAAFVTEVMIVHYESGKHLPRLGTKRHIEQVLGPIDWPTERNQHLRVPTLFV